MTEDLVRIAEDSAKGSFFLVTGNIIALVVQAIAVFVVARLLGPDLYGIYALSLVVPTLLLVIIGFGISQGIVRFSANLRAKGRNQQVARLIRHALLFRLVTGIIIFSLCFIFSDYFATYIVNRPDITVYIRLASTSIIFQVIFGTASSAFMGLNRMEYNALVTDVQASVKAAISILLVILGFGVAGALIGYVAGFLIAGLLSATLLYFKFYKPLNSNGDGNIQEEVNWKVPLKIMLSYGYPLYISALLLAIIPQLQSIILALFASNYDIGNFRASLNFVSLLSTLTVPIATSLFPAFSKLDKNSENLKIVFKLSIKYISLLVVPSTLLMIILSKEITQIVYGASFASAPIYLSLYAMLYLLVGLGYAVQRNLFNGLGETKQTLKVNLIQLAFFVVLAPFLTKALGVTGLIASILTSNASATIYGAYIAKSKYKAELDYKSLIRVYLVALVSAAPAFLAAKFLPFSTIPVITTAGAVYLISYLTILPIARAITKPELKNIENIVKKIRPIRPIANIIIKYEYAIMRALATRTHSNR